jgi:hypothetical protein
MQQLAMTSADTTRAKTRMGQSLRRRRDTGGATNIGSAACAAYGWVRLCSAPGPGSDGGRAGNSSVRADRGSCSVAPDAEVSETEPLEAEVPDAGRSADAERSDAERSEAELSGAEPVGRGVCASASGAISAGLGPGVDSSPDGAPWVFMPTSVMSQRSLHDYAGQ